jgi:uncharacterized protein (DUF1697 family)
MLKLAMAVVICLLRGVNIGGHHKIKMDALRALCESLKLRDPQTYIQSGNVVFRTAERDLARLARRLENAIEQACGFRPDVMLRTVAELRNAVAGSPFQARPGIEPGKLAVIFLAAEPASECCEKLLQIQADPEELHIRGRELYIYFPNGMGRPKLSPPLLERTLRTSGTGRNWNSVMKLLEMAEKLEASR